MRILVITSCTGEKRVTHERSLLLDDFRKGAEHIRQREAEVSGAIGMAEALYTGQQHVRLMRGIEKLRSGVHSDTPVVVDLRILSAGYGLIEGRRMIAPYEATFQGMSRHDLRSWADALGIPDAFRGAVSTAYDLGLILLGDRYLEACALDDSIPFGGPTLLFCGKNTLGRLPQFESFRAVALTNAEAKRFSCGLVALKGEIASRILSQIAVNRDFAEVLYSASDVLALVETPVSESAQKKVAIAKPTVDRVIAIPESWRNKTHRSHLRYFIPEWDDLIDPDFDFENDIHSGGRGDWSNEVYAHQSYPEPNYDGILISKVVAEKSKKKKERINSLGVHRFLRVPSDFPIMGDCGAFGYIKEAVPPYTTDEVIDYYTRLGFDMGVSLDHLIVTSTEAQKKERYQLTIENASEFFRKHRAAGLPWTPIGAVQGWNADSYSEAAKNYVAMGYTYIGLGGLVRTSTIEILEVLQKVHDVVPPSVRIHLFGLARIRSLKDFADLGVRSVDSASLLRRAWMGTGQNYLSPEGKFYTAIRIPEAGKSFRAKRMVSEGRASAEQVKRLEATCLRAMKQFDEGVLSVEEALDALSEYDHLITPDRPPTRDLLRETLEERPWRLCQCEICRHDGIQVVIFRGNNRNRRRGFHNIFVYYRLLQRALSGEPIAFYSGRTRDAEVQHSLFGVEGTVEEVADAL